MPRKLILYGGGDLAVEAASYLKDIDGDAWEVSDVISLSRSRLSDLSALLGQEPRLSESLGAVSGIAEKSVLIGIGDARIRHRALKEVRALGARLATLVHPGAYVAGTARIGAGSIICPFAFVGPFAEIGENCAINVGAVVGHDVVLGASTVLSPGATISGHGKTGIAAFLGSRAVIVPGIALGNFSKLSAASVLTRSTDAGFLVHGNPASGRQMIKVEEQDNYERQD